VKQNAIEKTDNRAQATIRATNNRTAIKDDDQLLVAEIYDAVTNTVLVLVEGLEYPAAEYVPEQAVEGFFPFVVLVLNRFPRRLYGLSDTELQAKSQAAANRMMAGMDEARRAAQPRFAYDANQLDAEDAERIANGEPWEMIPLKLGGKDIREAIFPLVGNHEFNQAEYDPSVALPEHAQHGRAARAGAGRHRQGEVLERGAGRDRGRVDPGEVPPEARAPRLRAADGTWRRS
jgi:hypothetical protein